MFKLAVLLAVNLCAVSGLTISRTLTKPVGTSRIINGIEATPGEFPHQAALLSLGATGGSHMCGASVIAHDWVLTAAHCVDGRTASSIAIVVDLHDYTNPGNYIWFDIAEIIMHGSYNSGPGGYPNDVALLRLVPNGADITKNIISLASGSNTFAGQICTISGWGVKVDGSGAAKLKKADVSVLTKSQCVDYWGSRNILDQHVCVKGYATSEGSGSCNHGSYNSGPGGYPNDVALLRLVPNGADITKNIISLASGSNTFAGQICTISGWGVKVDGSGAAKLKKADVSVLTKSECVGYWGSRNILDQHVCVKGYATSEGSGSCNGDSGGPLVCGNELVGVTSWGFSGCHQDGTVTHPSVYARVSSFNDWVNTNCGNCNL